MLPFGELRGGFIMRSGLGELITEVEVPFTAGGSAFLEVSPRKGDFAVLAAASVSFAFKQRLFAPNEVERKSVHCAQVEVRAR